MDSTTKKSFPNVLTLNISYVLNRLPIIKIGNLYSVSAVTCMDDLPITNKDSNMANAASISIENQVAGLELGRGNVRAAASLAS